MSPEEQVARYGKAGMSAEERTGSMVGRDALPAYTGPGRTRISGLPKNAKNGGKLAGDAAVFLGVAMPKHGPV
jgi:hypothetical protein